MTDRWELRKLVIAALKNAKTIARENIFSPGDTPSWNGEYPKLVIRSPRERKDSLGRVAPQFNTVATITVVGQLEAPTEEEAETQLDTFGKQIERALINDFDLTEKIQQFLFVETQTTTTSEGKGHIGEIAVAFGLEFYQGQEDFAPIEADPIEQVTLTADMAAPFDPQGIYKNPPYPKSVTTPPRTTGPDGRAETGFTVNFPPEE
jgi:hypothetical protein